MFQVIQIAYWLALATWFGGVLFVLITAPVIFRTIREDDPTLPKVLSVNMEGQHATLLASTVVGNLLRVLANWQVSCASVLLLAMIGQWFFVDRGGPDFYMALVRLALCLGAIVLMLYHWRVLWPRIQKYRQEYIDHADEPEIANAAQEQFNHYDRENLTILFIIVSLLLGLILFSSNIHTGGGLTISMP